MADFRGTVQDFGRVDRVEATRDDQDAVSEDEQRHRAAERSEIHLRHASLMRAIEGEILPRLLLAHGDSDVDQAVPVDGGGGVESHHVREFARILIEHDGVVAESFVNMLQVSRGLTADGVLLDLFAPTARELGDMWLSDACTFAEVTVGLCGLECLLMRRTDVRRAISDDADPDRQALLSPMPGEQHIFGLLIVKELFRRSGWSVSTPVGGHMDALLDAVRQSRFAVVGLSLSREEERAECARLVRSIRQASRNSDVVIVVGGHGVLADSASCETLGADLIALDGREALAQIECLVDQRMERRLYH